MPKKPFLGGQKCWPIFSLGMYHKWKFSLSVIISKFPIYLYTKTKTKCLKDPMYDIYLSKFRCFKEIKCCISNPGISQSPGRDRAGVRGCSTKKSPSQRCKWTQKLTPPSWCDISETPPSQRCESQRQRGGRYLYFRFKTDPLGNILRSWNWSTLITVFCQRNPSHWLLCWGRF